MYDIMAASVAYKTAFNHPSKSSWRAHDGFQRVYHGVKAQAFKSLRNAMFTISSRSSEPWDLVITAHSLGAAVSYLALLDLLHRNTDGDILESDVPILPLSTNITICVFGSPRVANTFLVGHYRELIKEWREKRGRSAALTEWSIIGHRDGMRYPSQTWQLTISRCTYPPSNSSWLFSPLFTSVLFLLRTSLHNPPFRK